MLQPKTDGEELRRLSAALSSWHRRRVPRGGGDSR